MHLTPDDPTPCAEFQELVVGDCGDRTLEGPSGSGRGSYSRRSLRPAGGRQRLTLKPEGEALLKLPSVRE